jgi:hypothetical protein
MESGGSGAVKEKMIEVLSKASLMTVKEGRRPGQ